MYLKLHNQILARFSLLKGSLSSYIWNLGLEHCMDSDFQHLDLHFWFSKLCWNHYTECFQNQIWTSKIRNREKDLDVLIGTDTTKGEAEEIGGQEQNLNVIPDSRRWY